ncbi:uncharacterized protein METZ01_LOCUS93024 [marine metagenome]|uniref:Uncharacterized protein n=1 Tax=marine metagenome TaxID=408172 RepID=A0A381VIP1_9ZZZZ
MNKVNGLTISLNDHVHSTYTVVTAEALYR